MKTTLYLKGLGILSMTSMLFGCPPVDNNATPDDDMGMSMDMGSSVDQGDGGSVDQGGGGGADLGSQDQGDGVDQGGGEVDQGSGPPMTFEEARDQDRELKAALICKAAFDCDPSGLEDLLDLRFKYASAQECVMQIVGENDASYAQQKVSLDAGRATFDVALAQQCILDLQSTRDGTLVCDLDELVALFDRCDSYVEGSVIEGGDCIVDADCQGEDGYCEPSAESCVGTCFDLSIGCEQQCGDGTYCDGQMCAPYANLMEECGEGLCADGLFCNFDLETPVCETLRGVGADCFLDECQLDLYCDFDMEVCTQRKEVGVSCMELDECVEGAYCDEDTFMCTSFADIEFTISVAQDGEPCLDISDSEIAICAEGFYCTDVVYDEQADLEQGTCKAMAKAINETCVYDFECAPELDCNGELCVARSSGLADGAPCYFSDECASGYCNLDTDVCASPDSCTL